MRRWCALGVLTALLMCVLTCTACDHASSGIVIGDNGWIPDDNFVVKPGYDETDHDKNKGGIGENDLVDLPYLSIS